MRTTTLLADLSSVHSRFLSPPVRSSSPDFEVVENTEDSIVLDPELAKIARKAEIEVRRQASVTPGPGRDSTPADIGGPEIVTLKVKWRPHPLKKLEKLHLLEFKLKRVCLLRVSSCHHT